MTTNQQAARLDFLFKAGHTLFAGCPPLSRFYLSDFQQTLRQHDISPAVSISQLSCSRCGQIYAPGVNSTAKVETKRSKIKKHKNRVVYKCNACDHVTVFRGSEKNRIPTKTSAENIIAASENLQGSKFARIPLIDSKQKKSKKNHLHAVLAQRKKQQQQNTDPGLGLEDFLSSL